jgi:hypothetical protein
MTLNGLISVEETYQAVKSLQVLRSNDYDAPKILKFVSESLTSSSTDIKDIFYGLRTIELLGGKDGRTVAAVSAHCHLRCVWKIAVGSRIIATVQRNEDLVRHCTILLHMNPVW